MSLIEAFILGIIQGATEFLPVSSSGHSILLPAIFGMTPPTLGAVIVAHLGTLLSVLIFYARDLAALIRGTVEALGQRNLMANSDSRLAVCLLLGSIPVAIIGLLFEPFFENVFTDPRWAALFLIGTAIALIVGEKMLSGSKSLNEITSLDAIIIGAFQILALFPGMSRSGTTIVGGLTRGLDRSAAARFSFLLSIPVIAGAGILKLPALFMAADIADQIGIYAVVFITSALVGYACISFLIRWLRNRSLYPFAIYCATLGISYLLYSAFS